MHFSLFQFVVLSLIALENQFGGLYDGLYIAP